MCIITIRGKKLQTTIFIIKPPICCKIVFLMAETVPQSPKRALLIVLSRDPEYPGMIRNSRNDRSSSPLDILLNQNNIEAYLLPGKLESSRILNVSLVV